MTMAYMYVIGVFFIGYTYKFNRQLLRVSWKALSYWAVFLVFNSILKFYLLKIPAMHEMFDIGIIASIPWYYMILAGFEEAMFTLPIYYVMIYTDNKYIRAILMSSLAFVFASGHAYQGLLALIPTYLYMRHIAPQFMKRIGFITMVLAHIMFDLSMWATIQVSNNPNLLDFSMYTCKLPW